MIGRIGLDPTEHQIQVTLIGMLRQWLRPEIVRFSVPNGGLRNARVQQKLIDEGLLPGMPDLGFARHEGQTFWLEMKGPKGSLRDEQKGVRYKLTQLGHEWQMARSVDEALDHLGKAGLLK